LIIYSNTGGGNNNPFQYSCLENSMDRGAWWATVHGVAKSRIWLSNWAHTFKHSLKQCLNKLSSIYVLKGVILCFQFLICYRQLHPIVCDFLHLILLFYAGSEYYSNAYWRSHSCNGTAFIYEIAQCSRRNRCKFSVVMLNRSNGTVY